MITRFVCRMAAGEMRKIIPDQTFKGRCLAILSVWQLASIYTFAHVSYDTSHICSHHFNDSLSLPLSVVSNRNFMLCHCSLVQAFSELSIGV